MAELSPAAQAILDAVNGRCSYGPDDVLNESRWIAAAALRAAANQVTPGPWLVSSCCDERERSICGGLLAIANELDPS